MEKSAKSLVIGDRFKMSMNHSKRKGYLILEVFEIEPEPYETPWVEVIEAHYETLPGDKYDAEDRYEKGDEFPYCYTYVELIN